MNKRQQILLLLNDMTIPQIAKELGTSRQNIAVILEYMGRKKLVAKHPNLYRITKLGREFVKPVIEKTIDDDKQKG